MFCKEIALGPVPWPTGRDRLCAVGAVLWKEVGIGGLTGIGMFAAGSETRKLSRATGGLLAKEPKCRPLDQ